ncbi:MAG: serine/threonine protein kinase [Planctomycetes bacterium]|nr:serine/threonine protein kinase [Planctomycetota bacterium]
MESTGTYQIHLSLEPETLQLLDASEQPATGPLGERPSLLAHLEAKEACRYSDGPELGRGSMGVVRRVLDRDLGREVALKQLKPGGGMSVARFLREVQITGQLEHSGVLPVHDLGYTPERGFHFVMRLVRDSEDLGQLIQRLRAGDPQAHADFGFERRVQIVQRLAQTLHFAHSRGVIHRDVKPENVVLSRAGDVYLVDWGVARLVDEPASAPSDSATWPAMALDPNRPKTREGTIVGTPYYMSPEQLKGAATPDGDVYSLSAVLYELLTLRHYLGEQPETLAQLVTLVRAEARTSADAFRDPQNGRVPRGLAVICARGVARDPAERYASAHELELALEAWLEGRGPIVCGTTCLVRSLHAWRRAAELRPHLVTRVTVLGIALALLSLGLHALQIGLWLAD